MVRVGSLYDQTLLDKKIRENKTGMTSQEQIDAILKRRKIDQQRKEAVYEELMACVAEQGIRILRFNELDEDGARISGSVILSQRSHRLFRLLLSEEDSHFRF